MKNFDILRPATLAKAVELLPKRAASHPGALAGRPLAGGQDLLVELKDHLAEPDELIDLRGLKEASDFGPNPDGSFRIGALTTVATLTRDQRVRDNYAVLAEAADSIASPQIRTQATLGGNLCQRPRCMYYRNEETVCLKRGGDECFSFAGLNKYNAILGGGPSYIVHPSDLAPALIALDASIQIQGAGTREMALEDFFTLPSESDVTRENVLAPNEIVRSVTIPARGSDWRTTYVKFKERESFDWALSAVALALRIERDRIAEARLILGGVAPIPWRVRSAEALLVGRPADERAAAAAADEALRGAEPLEQNEYKVPLTRALIHKAMTQLAN